MIGGETVVPISIEGSMPQEWSKEFDDKMIAAHSKLGPFYKRADWLAADFVLYMTFGPNDCQWMIPGTQRD